MSLLGRRLYAPLISLSNRRARGVRGHTGYPPGPSAAGGIEVERY